ncbi:polyketide synthase dehydratase domain-containing protein [Limimaricola cinnabarinus]|uniref:polyketide synthase dehydratase domain-containing protein n=1 Tax=Limimaricola cinnabarinus TaxID=1125964 RepID=UPI001F3995C6|nr:polyketide synthase dehydratase domain-containing protein [Limimaricola cinnabarinus]
MPAGAQGGLVLHPGLLDIATGWAIGLIEGYDPVHLWVPAGYAELRIHAPLPSEILSHARLVRQQKGVAWFDLVLCSPKGQICVEVSGFELRLLPQGMAFGAPPRGTGQEGPPATAQQALLRETRRHAFAVLRVGPPFSPRWGRACRRSR